MDQQDLLPDHRKKPTTPTRGESRWPSFPGGQRCWRPARQLSLLLMSRFDEGHRAREPKAPRRQCGSNSSHSSPLRSLDNDVFNTRPMISCRSLFDRPYVQYQSRVHCEYEALRQQRRSCNYQVRAAKCALLGQCAMGDLS